MNRQLLEDVFGAALAAADPRRMVVGLGSRLHSFYREGGFKQLYVAGFGKAACAMAEGLEKTIPELITEGVLVTKDGHARGCRLSGRLAVFEASHPVPDERGVAASQRIMSLAEAADERTLFLCLISGGGSALFAMPVDSVTLREKRLVTDMLLRSGATIEELNTVRKHISRVKGGQLAAAAYPASVVSLILSDVIGDRLDVIASGPTVPDPSTFADVRAILEKYGLLDKVPGSVLELVEDGITGQRPETPKEGDRVFGRVKNIIIGSNKLSLDAASARAAALGFETRILSAALSGESRDVARMLAREAVLEQERLTKEGKGKRCLLCGGETTVTVNGTGNGGRNLEMALAFAMAIEGRENILFLSAGTDGTDGPTDAAGAVVDGGTVERRRKAGYRAEDYLHRNDSYNYFKGTKELLVTGPTGTNVMDVQIVLVSSPTR